ncbi:unnamed protein product [Pseudo-nitzschia multistriata]|uniref:Uncharacterized protein n=1 Tax=Pseudo-nitzschia multistriata TaxID=183589 RepID=A0A448ZS24_9STRA|nr:unnamed protein product [Pseudo-nitzschia multistriata]
MSKKEEGMPAWNDTCHSGRDRKGASPQKSDLTRIGKVANGNISPNVSGSQLTTDSVIQRNETKRNERKRINQRIEQNNTIGR